MSPHCFLSSWTEQKDPLPSRGSRRLEPHAPCCKDGQEYVGTSPGVMSYFSPLFKVGGA